jgi:hypothetical protein
MKSGADIQANSTPFKQIAPLLCTDTAHTLFRTHTHEHTQEDAEQSFPKSHEKSDVATLAGKKIESVSVFVRVKKREWGKEGEMHAQAKTLVPVE